MIGNVLTRQRESRTPMTHEISSRTPARMSRRMLVFGAAGITPLLLLEPAGAQDEATPVANLLVSVAEQVAELDGKDRIWQINRVIVQDDDDDEDFRVRLGFAYAHEIAVELDFDDDDDDDNDGLGDDVTLEVGQGVAIRNRDDIDADPVGTSIGSFYTLELIDPEDVNNDDNRLAIGTPFPTESGAHTLTLWSGTATTGATIAFGDGAASALVLLLDGTLTYTHEEGEATTLAAGEAASGSGAGQVEAGENGASFVVVTLVQGDAA